MVLSHQTNQSIQDKDNTRELHEMEDSTAEEIYRTSESLTGSEGVGVMRATVSEDHRVARLFTRFSSFDLFIRHSQQKWTLLGVTCAHFQVHSCPHKSARRYLTRTCLKKWD